MASRHSARSCPPPSCDNLKIKRWAFPRQPSVACTSHRLGQLPQHVLVPFLEARFVHRIPSSLLGRRGVTIYTLSMQTHEHLGKQASHRYTRLLPTQVMLFRIAHFTLVRIKSPFAARVCRHPRETGPVDRAYKQPAAAPHNAAAGCDKRDPNLAHPRFKERSMHSAAAIERMVQQGETQNPRVCGAIPLPLRVRGVKRRLSITAWNPHPIVRLNLPCSRRHQAFEK